MGLRWRDDKLHMIQNWGEIEGLWRVNGMGNSLAGLCRIGNIYCQTQAEGPLTEVWISDFPLAGCGRGCSVSTAFLFGFFVF